MTTGDLKKTNTIWVCSNSDYVCTRFFFVYDSDVSISTNTATPQFKKEIDNAMTYIETLRRHTKTLTVSFIFIFLLLKVCVIILFQSNAHKPHPLSLSRLVAPPPTSCDNNGETHGLSKFQSPRRVSEVNRRCFLCGMA